MGVRDAIWTTPVGNTEQDYGCQSWVGDVGTFFSLESRPMHLRFLFVYLPLSSLHSGRGE